MEALEALLTRRTVHQYTPGEVPQEVLEAGLEAAHQAPCHRFTWPWRFTIVGSKGREAIAEVGVALKARGRDLDASARAAVRAKLLNPGALVVLRQVLAEDAAIREEDYAACACAAQNFMLALHAHGYGTKWSTGGVTRDPQTYACLGVDAERERIVGFLWAGTPAKIPTPPRPTWRDLVEQVP